MNAPKPAKQLAIDLCAYAASGTYGHECGNLATTVAVSSTKNERAKTKNGLFYSGRCDSCKTLGGRDNWGIIRFEPLANQINEWV